VKRQEQGRYDGCRVPFPEGGDAGPNGLSTVMMNPSPGRSSPARDGGNAMDSGLHARTVIGHGSRIRGIKGLRVQGVEGARETGIGNSGISDRGVLTFSRFCVSALRLFGPRSDHPACYTVGGRPSRAPAEFFDIRRGSYSAVQYGFTGATP